MVFSAEEHCLKRVLSSMVQELVKIRTQLLEVQEEVTSLSIKVLDYSGKLLEVQTIGIGEGKVAELVQEKEALHSSCQLQSYRAS